MKATHLGMKPNKATLAIQECQQLVQYGLNEPHYSQWASEAFYANKRAKKNKGKKKYKFLAN